VGNAILDWWEPFSQMEMIGHHDPGNLGSALVGALGGIVLTGVEMSLQLSQLIGPLAALFVMNAKDQ